MKPDRNVAAYRFCRRRRRRRRCCGIASAAWNSWRLRRHWRRCRIAWSVSSGRMSLAVFSGRCAHDASFPAYAKQVEGRIAAGDRIGLLIVSLHCWRSGDWSEGRDEVARVVPPVDLEVDRADWSIALARDVVVAARCRMASPTRRSMRWRSGAASYGWIPA